MALCSSALTARHGRLWRLGRDFASYAGGNVVSAGTAQFGANCRRSTAWGQVMAEVVFEGAGDRFETDERSAVIQGFPSRPDMGDYDMVVRIHSSTAATFSGVLPHDMRVVLGSQGREDAGHGLVALIAGQGDGRRQADMMVCDRGAGTVPHGFHVVQRLGGGPHRRGDMDHTRPLRFLARQVREQVSGVPAGASMPRGREYHGDGSRRDITATVRPDSSRRTDASASAGTRPP